MLKIVSNNGLMEAIKLAKETGTEKDLVGYLLYLNTWYGEDKAVVELCGDIPPEPGSLSWYAYKIIDGYVQKTAFYNGGLIFSDRSKRWGIHS